MHIAYLVSQYPALSHTFILREVMGLRQLGWTVTTISIRRPNVKELLTDRDRAEAAGTHVIVPPKVRKLIAALGRALVTGPVAFWRAMRAARKLRRPVAYFLEALLVQRICRRAGITHVHAHFANVAADVAMLVAVLNQKKGGTFSFTMHGPTEFYDVQEHRLAEKAGAAQFIVCISDFARSQMMALLPPEQWNKLEVVHCGVDPAQFAMPRMEEPADAVRAFEILCVARMTPVKGHAILLRAVGDLVAKGRHVTLTLAGDGPLRAALEAEASALGIGDRVRFLGNVGQDVIHTLYARAGVFALPSFAEGVPVVLMEAMAARCPVIATGINGIPELIEPGRTGLLVRPGRADLLAEAIEEVIARPEQAEMRAERAAEKIAAEFNLLTVAPKLAGIFRERLLGDGTGAPADWMGRADVDPMPGMSEARRAVQWRTSHDRPRGAA